VLPVGDSMEEIFEAIKRAAIIHKSGGGTGFAFSRLRSENAIVESTGGKASGPVSFLKVFNAATEAVKQGGTRRGANMGVLRVDHPDILKFIDCKREGEITNFNISVAATDEFMDALEKDETYALVDPHTREVTERLRARDVFNRIVENAWATGDPGMIFIDRVNRTPANPVPELGPIEATNPCGEQPLQPNDVCNLGSINLGRFVVNDNGKPRIDYENLERVVRIAVRFLDDVIDVNPYPIEEIAETVRANRRIGLGVMGVADLFIEMGIPYASEQATSLAEEIITFIHDVGHDESARLAQERGHFPNWPRSIYRDGRPLRNSTVTTIAPTGTISIIAGCSSGIEPLFALAYRHISGDRHLTFVNPLVEEVLQREGLYSDKLMEEIISRGTVRGMENVPEHIQQLLATAHDIPPEWHVRMQAAFQKGTDNGVSKTINLPNSATVEDVADAYLLAWQLGCIGITVFRDGCLQEQVLHVGAGEKETQKKEESPAEYPTHITPRPRVVRGVTYRSETPLGTAFITVNETEDGEPFEVFANVGKAGSDTASVSEAIGRLCSLCLRLPSPMPPRERLKAIIGQLSGIGGGRQLGFGPDRIRSLPDAVAQVLAEHMGLTDSHREAKTGQLELLKVGDLCPECGEAALVFEEGCMKCYSCGYTEC